MKKKPKETFTAYCISFVPIQFGTGFVSFLVYTAPTIYLISYMYVCLKQMRRIHRVELNT